MMSKQQLYIILDDWESGFSIRKVDLNLHQLIPGGRNARDAAASLPPPCIRFKARQESPVCFSDALGSKILCLQPQDEGKNVPDMGGLCYDVRESSLNYIPRHTRQLRPVYFPVGDKLFALGNCSMELLDLQPLMVTPSPSSSSHLSWRKLPNAAFDSLYVISHTVITVRKTILVSVDITRTTYSFHMEDFTWERLGDWVLPFDGCGYFIQELDTWVGLALYGDEPGRICSCNLASATTFEHLPEVKYGKEYLFTKDPTEKHRGSKLVYMGGGHDNRFCLMECIELVGNKDEYLGQDEVKVEDPPRGVHMFRLTKFSLKLDEKGDLTIGNSRHVRYYKVPNKEINDLLFMWPLAFCLKTNYHQYFLGVCFRS